MPHSNITPQHLSVVPVALFTICLAPSYALATIPYWAVVVFFLAVLLFLFFFPAVSACIKYMLVRKRIPPESKHVKLKLFGIAMLETMLVAVFIAITWGGFWWLDPPEIPAWILSYISVDLAVWYFRYMTYDLTVPFLLTGLLVVATILLHIMLLRDRGESLKSAVSRDRNAVLAFLMSIITPLFFSTIWIIHPLTDTRHSPHVDDEAKYSIGPSIRNQQLDECLWKASRKNLPRIVRELVKRGAHVNATPYGDTTPLLIACRKRHNDIAKFLVSRGADVNAKDRQGRPALGYACMNRRLDLVKLLLEKGANVDAETIPHLSALAYACWTGNVELVKLLLENGARVDWGIPRGTTLFKMARGPHQKQIRELLKQHGVTE